MRILQRSKGAAARVPLDGASTYQWRQVPNINLVAQPRRRIKTAHLIRGLLILAILVEAYWLQSNYRGKQGIDDDEETLSSDLRRVQQQISARAAEVNGLKGQITALETERQTLEKPYKVITSDRVEWETALSALLEARPVGIVFESITTETGGVIQLIGSALDTDRMVEFQSRVTSPESPLEMVSLNLSSGSNPGSSSGGGNSEELLQFTANFLIR